MRATQAPQRPDDGRELRLSRPTFPGEIGAGPVHRRTMRFPGEAAASNRRARHAAVALCVSVALALACGCSSGPPGPSKPGNRQMASAVEKVSGISVTLRSVPAVVPAGGTFSLTLTVRNLTGEKVDYELTSGQTFDFIAFDAGGNEVWRYSRGLSFIQILRTVEVPPGDSVSYKAAWETGSAQPGLFVIQGFFKGIDNVRPAVSVEITAS